MSILLLTFATESENKEKTMKQNGLSHPARPMERQATGRQRRPATNVAGLLVVQDAMYVGGVVGDNSSTVTACYHATGNVTGVTESTGGVAGRNYSSSILMTCYWDGTVTGNKGIGYDMTNFSETQEVDGDWKEAVLNMNSVLAGYDWEWTIESSNTLPTLKKKETN